ncbi:hypothetical protein QFC24_005505 [Naganishia onofrii]|uniref:Uncharacterized protein n=1 Tax=Naganishia onofrii TaxID=1851511 RepID=A0ACC2X868_9TREE|nr:hypothetical protein QFC24_005505 [Naganishia onofrii]
MLLKTLSTIVSLLPAALLLQTASVAAVPIMGPVTIYTPPTDYTNERTLYARAIQLEHQKSDNGLILSTWENYSPANEGPTYFPIYSSTNNGKKWSNYSSVHDQVNGVGLKYQPDLYELPRDIGNFKEGTILLAGNSIPRDLSTTQIDLYASTDKGKTWKFISHIANGGVALPNNGETPVWEPRLMEYNGKIICYYSDQRDPKYGQKMVHQITSDLYNWGPVVDDVTSPVYDHRPGMPTVAHLPNGQYIMTYEFYGAPETAFAVYYKLSDDPTTFGSKQGQVIRSQDGTVPVGSPFIVWTPAGPDENGTLVVSASSNSEVFLNSKLGAADAWIKVATDSPAAYTRGELVLKDSKRVALIAGGQLGKGPTNSVTWTTIDIPRK